MKVSVVVFEYGEREVYTDYVSGFYETFEQACESIRTQGFHTGDANGRLWLAPSAIHSVRPAEK